MMCRLPPYKDSKSKCSHMVASQNKGEPQYRPQNTIIILKGTPKKGTPNFGKPSYREQENQHYHLGPIWLKYLKYGCKWNMALGQSMNKHKCIYKKCRGIITQAPIVGAQEESISKQMNRDIPFEARHSQP